MRNKVSYEWVAEETDEHGDIIEPWFGESLHEVLYCTMDSQFKVRVALVRNEGNDEDGLQDRQYAYVVNGLLEPFDGGAMIPKRFFKEVHEIYNP